MMSLQMETAVTSEPRPSLVDDEENGITFADALRLLKRALYVFVAVPHGYRGDWDYCPISKSRARRFLTGNSRNLTDPLVSNLRRSKYDMRASLFIGTVYDAPAPREIA